MIVSCADKLTTSFPPLVKRGEPTSSNLAVCDERVVADSQRDNAAKPSFARRLRLWVTV